jgi:multiple sugar transport system substrate-binding protein
MNQTQTPFPGIAMRTIVKKSILHGLLFITLMSCSSQPAPVSVSDISDYRVLYLDEIPPVEECPDGRVCIRWFVGTGSGTNPEQIAVEEEVARDFNASQDRIMVTLEVAAFSPPFDTLSTQFAYDNAPDVIGPAGWHAYNYLKDESLDLSEQIAASGFDTGIFDPALVRSYQTEEGQVSLPFAVYPGAIYYVPAMFDAAGLAYPPQTYGAKYVLDGNEVDWNWDTVTEVAKRLTLDVNSLNSTEEGFDRTQIVQIGYSPQWQQLFSVATFYSGAAKVYEGSGQGSYQSTIPDGWKEAWRWYYDGMYGDQPFIANGPFSDSPEFGSGNVFNSGKAAMGLTQAWYTCCLGDFAKAGNEFQLGIQPMGADGNVHGRVDADSFLIYKGTRHPAEAFQFVVYLLTTGADKLLPAYTAMPAIASKTDAFFDAKANDYPFVSDASWNVFVQGLAYPDIPSAEQYQPNRFEAARREEAFMELMSNTPPDQFDFEVEFKKLVDNLNVIYNE